MFSEKLNQNIRQKIHKIIAEEPSTMPMNLAKECGISEAAAVSALPEEMRFFVDAEHFDDIWQAMRAWEKITFISPAPCAIIEFKGKLPRGVHGHGFFNLMEKDHPLGGHLRINELGGICFLEKLFFGLKSMSVQFYDRQGAQMFSIYVGREKKQLIDSVKHAYLALRQTYIEEKAP